MIQKKRKSTSEKLVFLSPLKFKEALAGLLEVKPKEEKEDDQMEGKKNLAISQFFLMYFPLILLLSLYHNLILWELVLLPVKPR